MEKHWDENSKENSEEHHTGKECITENCTEKAGTAWSPYWCWKCNAQRLDRISDQLDKIKEK